MYERTLTILNSNSFFLFGARGTGKTTFLRNAFSSYSSKKIFWIDLLNPDEEDLYVNRPESFREQLDASAERPEWVVIDEIQRAPRLLDLVHSLIEAPTNKDRSLKFALTGSSARKLKRGTSNLLAGRAFTYNLYPLTHTELGKDFNLQEVLTWGSLPFIMNNRTEEEKLAFLKSYTATYLKEEIAQEQLVRNIVPFRKFLPIAAQCSGTIINYNKISKDLKVDWSTVKNYFEILEDTLIGFLLPALTRSVRKQQISAPKFYLFDTGITRAFNKTLTIPPTTDQMRGPLFEQFIICEMFRLNSYLKKDFTFSYLTTQGGAEVDLVIERPGATTLFVEIKLTDNITDSHLKHIKALSANQEDVEAYCFCQEKRARKLDNVLIVPWQEGFERIGLS